jgi:anti-anti-sigma factor
MTIEIEQCEGVCVVRCKGRFVSGADVEYVRSKIAEIQGLKCEKVLADLREVPSIGSAGLAFIVAIYNSVVKDSGGQFVVAGAPPFVRKALDLTRLSSVVSIVADATAGLAVLRGH